jgi:outer membrane protein OmpA-like peptidoglycan-associated protein
MYRLSLLGAGLLMAAGCVSNAAYLELQTSRDQALEDKGNLQSQLTASNAEAARIHLEKTRAEASFFRLQAEQKAQTAESAHFGSINKEGAAVLGDMSFVPGSWTLDAKAHKFLDGVAVQLNKKGAVSRIQIVGHTDNTPIVHAAVKSNEELGQKRAEAVKNYLTSKGVKAPMVCSSMGEKLNKRMVVISAFGS